MPHFKKRPLEIPPVWNHSEILTDAARMSAPGPISEVRPRKRHVRFRPVSDRTADIIRKCQKAILRAAAIRKQTRPEPEIDRDARRADAEQVPIGPKLALRNVKTSMAYAEARKPRARSHMRASRALRAGPPRATH